MREQERLKAEIERLLPGDKAEISDLPIFYQGFDDGWIYQANEHTRESEEVQRIRREHAVGGNGTANDNDTAALEAVPRHYVEQGKRLKVDNIKKSAEATAKIKQIDKANRHSESMSIGASPKTTVAELQSAIQNLPSVIAVIDKLQKAGNLTPSEKRVEGRIRASLKKAGIEFDYTLSDPDQLREVYTQAQATLQGIQQGSEKNSSEIAMAMLTLQGTQALAGGPFDTVRMMQSDSMLERLSLAFQRYLPIARKAAVPTVTARNIEAAKGGPIDYEAAYQEFRDLFAGADSQTLENAGAVLGELETLNATSPGELATTIGSSSEEMNAHDFREKLAGFDEVVIKIGDIVLSRGERGARRAG